VVSATPLLALLVAMSPLQGAVPVPLRKSFEVDLQQDRILIDLPLATETGDTPYLFWCRGGNPELLNEMSDRGHINYVPPLMCVLNEGGDRSESSLLAEDDVAPWHTPGKFHLEELVGACGDYPEFGRKRTFRLRGFVLDPME
jgi:hypothetical protein